MAKTTFRPLSELCADFKKKCGSDSKDTSVPDDSLWEALSARGEVPSEVASTAECDKGEEEQMYNPQVQEAKTKGRMALSSLDKPQEKNQAPQKKSKGNKIEMDDIFKADEPEKPEKPERKRDKHDKAEKSDKAEKADKADTADGNKAVAAEGTPIVASDTAANDAGAAAAAKPSDAAHTGILTKLVERKGFGFIVPDVEGTGDVFLHCSELLGAVCGDMFVGMRVRYDVEVDSRSGKMRARNAVILEADPAERSDKRIAAVEDAQAGTRKGKDSEKKGRANACFTRGEFLSLFRRLGRPYGKASKVGIFSVKFPKILRERRWGYSDSESCSESESRDSSWMEEDAGLDDEDLIAAVETRLSKESGFDVHNQETFGESAGRGWSFEEALAANARLVVPSPGVGPFVPAVLPQCAELPEAMGDLEEWCPATTAGDSHGSRGSRLSADGGELESWQSRAESPAEGTEAEAAGAEAVPEWIREGLQLQ